MSKVATYKWTVYRGTDARFAFEVGSKDEDGSFVPDDAALTDTYKLTISGIGWSYSPSLPLTVSDGKVQVHLSPAVTGELEPHRKYQGWITRTYPSGEVRTILDIEIFTRGGS